MDKHNDNMARFDAVDQAAHPGFFTRFMDKSHMLQAAGIYKQMVTDLLAIKEGAALLDVGCGVGQDALTLAGLVGPAGRVVGIDASETMIQEARARAAEAHLPVEYLSGDAYRLPFADGTFDGCQSSRVFEHLSEPGRALAEMVRVARPGARIVVADADFDLTIVDIPDRTLARKMIHLVCDNVRQGWMGRQLPQLFREAGLCDIVINGRVLPSDFAFFRMVFDGILQRALAAGALSTEELARFWSDLEQAEREQRFFGGVVGFVVGGQKPEV
jgi:ubiquinone/menaquinone biosynthesis C-methylase UbiE